MRPFSGIAVVAGVLLFAETSQAQFVGGFAARQTAYFQVRTGPFSGFAYAGRTYAYAYGPIYGGVPMWYYGYPGIPIVNNPIQIQPPIVINNIIQAPGIAAAPGARGNLPPPEFDPGPPPPKVPAPKVPAKPVKPPPQPAPPIILPDMKAIGPLGRADADRIVEAGRKAFADGQYGRALELFRKAADITPAEPSVHYLISQAYFSLGKYREAVSAIAMGMALRADWHEARFNSRDLYWKKPELFDDHLKALRDAVAAFPNDAELLFMLGHQLWFDGKHEDAKAIILKARTLRPGNTPADAFRVDGR
jgi:hypothetical protein